MVASVISTPLHGGTTQISLWFLWELVHTMEDLILGRTASHDGEEQCQVLELHFGVSVSQTLSLYGSFSPENRTVVPRDDPRLALRTFMCLTSASIFAARAS